MIILYLVSLMTTKRLNTRSQMKACISWDHDNKVHSSVADKRQGGGGTIILGVGRRYNILSS
jgi:hypothetical protein